MHILIIARQNRDTSAPFQCLVAPWSVEDLKKHTVVSSRDTVVEFMLMISVITINEPLMSINECS